MASRGFPNSSFFHLIQIHWICFRLTKQLCSTLLLSNFCISSRMQVSFWSDYLSKKASSFSLSTASCFFWVLSVLFGVKLSHWILLWRTVGPRQHQNTLHCSPIWPNASLHAWWASVVDLDEVSWHLATIFCGSSWPWRGIRQQFLRFLEKIFHFSKVWQFAPVYCDISVFLA